MVPIPPNKPVVRLDQADLIYKTEDAKFDAVVADIAERHEDGQPVLVGTASVEKSELLSKLLLRAGVPHEVLNAKNHAGRRRSSRRPAAPVRSPWPPTWPAAVPTSCSAATPTSPPTSTCVTRA